MTAISNTNSQLGASILNALGVGNGINVSNIVTQLVSAEGAPVTSQITTQTNAINTQLSGVSQLQSALSSFQNTLTNLQAANSFQADTITSSDSSIVSVSSGAGAQIAKHSITVQQLAAQQSSVTNTEYANNSAVVGTGSLTFTMGSGTSFSVNIDSSNDTLSGIAASINNATGNTGVSASIINVDSATPGGGTVSKLVLASQNSGTANAFTVTGIDDGTNNNGLTQLFTSNLTTQTKAADSIVQIDGQTATEKSNTITDVLPGVTLNLLNTSTAAVSVGVSLNTSSVSSAVNSFVSAYNNLNYTLQGLQAYGGQGGTNGALFGNPNAELITNQIRTLTTGVISSAAGGYNSLAMIGVSIDQTGTMSVNNTALNSALAANPQSVSNVFSSANGVINQLNTSIAAMTNSVGTLGSEKTTLNAELSGLQKQQSAENVYLDSYQATLQAEYSAMQTLVSQYNSTGSFLTSWVNSNNSSSSSSKG